MNQSLDRSLVSRSREVSEMYDRQEQEPVLMQGFPAETDRRVTWANWMSPPFNRWGFRNLARLRPTIEVAAGARPDRVLAYAPLALEELRFASSCGRSVSALDHLRASKTDGFLVLHQGRVVYERYFNGQVAADRHIMFSVTKSLIGILGEQLIHDGVLVAQAPTQHYVPELAGSAFGDATVRQLLDMAVGVHYTELYDDPTSESSQYGYACGFKPALPEYAQYESLYQYLPSLRKRGEHGGLFHYVTATTEVLAWVMERASGLGCAEQLQRVWQQLGCERDAYFMADPWGRSVAGAGFNATLRDMGRFGLMLANGGVVDGQQVIDQAVIEAIAAGGDPAVYGVHQDFSDWTPGASYRSQWYVFNDHSPALMASGIHGQYLFVDFASEVVIVKQSSLPEAVTELDIDTVRLLRALAAQLRG